MTEEERDDDGIEEVMSDAESSATNDEAEAVDPLFLSPEDSDAESIDEVATRESELTEAVAALEAERDDFKNRMIRAAADLENFRKRTNREKEELRRFGIDKVVAELIPVVDNFERALQHTESTDDNKSLLDGVQMIYRQIVSALGKHGVEGFEAVGEPFDPQRHEAIQQVETADYPAGTVVEQFQKGYFLHERLLRPALVSVSKRPSSESVETPASGSEVIEAPEESLAIDLTDEIEHERETAEIDAHLAANPVAESHESEGTRDESGEPAEEPQDG